MSEQYDEMVRVRRQDVAWRQADMAVIQLEFSVLTTFAGMERHQLGQLRQLLEEERARIRHALETLQHQHDDKE